jgi:hypothetical protein
MVRGSGLEIICPVLGLFQPPLVLLAAIRDLSEKIVLSSLANSGVRRREHRDSSPAGTLIR